MTQTAATAPPRGTEPDPGGVPAAIPFTGVVESFGAYAVFPYPGSVRTP
ncbi:hypothetical protein [Streptomyces corynorhini]|nr:hypothetical protein [Streptomyces corynorhini]